MKQSEVPGTDRTDETAAVRRTWEEVNAAFMAGDWDRYARLWLQSPDLQVVHPDHRDWISGWSEFAARYRDVVADGRRWTFRTNRLEVHVNPSGESAWALIEVVLTLDGRSETAWQMAAFEKEEGRWKIAAALSSQLGAAGGNHADGEPQNGDDPRGRPSSG